MASTAPQQQPLALFSSSAVSAALSPSAANVTAAYQQQQQQQSQNCIYSAYIINKAGGLIFHYQQQQTAVNHPKLTSNELLVLAGTFHGIHVISSKLQPLGLAGAAGSPSAAAAVPSAGVSSASAASQSNSANQGITHLLADTFQLLCHQSPTGVKFLLTASPQHPDARRLWAVVGERLPGLYADWAMKNPFYQPEMPVRCQLFDREVQRLFADEVLPL